MSDSRGNRIDPLINAILQSEDERIADTCSENIRIRCYKCGSIFYAAHFVTRCKLCPIKITEYLPPKAMLKIDEQKIIEIARRVVAEYRMGSDASIDDLEEALKHV